jgi:hypothetical protein
MILSSPLIQAIAALVIFVVGYLALFVSTLTCLGIAMVSYKGARILGSHMMSTTKRMWLARGNVALVTHHIARPSP